MRVEQPLASTRSDDPVVISDIAIDEMDRQTVDLLAALDTCPDRDCAPLLAALQSQMRRQAAAEAAWLRAAGDPELARHRREHEFWLDVVDVMRQRLARGDVRIVRWMAADLLHRCRTHSLWFGGRTRRSSPLNG